MIRARTRTYGLGNPPHIQPLLDAALCLFVSLVKGAVSTLGMIFNCLSRDWHTTQTREPLPQATSGNPQTGAQSFDAQHRDATLHDHANQHILRDDRRFAPIPQDEASWRCKDLVTTPTILILRDRPHVRLNSGGLAWRSSRRMCRESLLSQPLASRVRGNDSACD